ncbi:hypothetical protein [Sphingomonas aracearum]|uniref:DUF1983 domain-containing protein n=1 Tax=Sphingomonas aracearum TaxID=2283317 RepID=A0A369VW89_9SPHN|nr:hypothetical protein [Sphingomonas aracearum]RDE05440.1 hypothetical protein DVW87_09320 [Sphingomonas aracearum]
MDFDAGDVLGNVSWETGPNGDARKNIVRGKFTDPSPNSLFQPIDYPAVSIPNLDGIDRIDPFTVAIVQSGDHAQRLAKLRLMRLLYSSRFAADINAKAWGVKDGQVVRLTFPALGFYQKLFRVEAVTVQPSGVAPMVLIEEDASIYAPFTDVRSPVSAAAPIRYDPLNLPLVQAIDQAGQTAEWPQIVGEGKPADNATNSADPDSPFGSGKVRDALAEIERIDPLTSDLSALQEAKVGTDRALEALGRSYVDQEATLRQIDRDAGRIDETLLRLLAESNRTREVLRDAGIVVDPETGIVRLYAIDQLAERTSRAEVTLDGQAALISQKASVSYVAEQIALAVLDPAQAAQLEPIIARLTEAEQTIDGLNAAVALRATVVDVTAQGGRLTGVEQDLDALAGTVSTKASQTTVDDQGARLALAEQQLTAIGETTSYSVVIRQARAVADDAAEAALRGLVAGDAADRRSIAVQAEIRQELYTRILSGEAAEAIARTQLGVQIGLLDARSVQETALRIAGDKVSADRIDGTAGKRVRVDVQLNAYGSEGGALFVATAQLMRRGPDGSVVAIGREVDVRGPGLAYPQPFGWWAIDYPPAGTSSYFLRGKLVLNQSGSRIFQFVNIQIAAEETKR